MSGPILVFGAEGQLGREVVGVAKARDIEVAGCNRVQSDITDFSAVEAAIFSTKPRIALNAAAYAAVDKAETEREAAYAANVWERNWSHALLRRNICLSYTFRGM